MSRFDLRESNKIPPLGLPEKPIEERKMTRKSDPGRDTVESSVGIKILTSNACPKRFVLNCISYPSVVTSAGTAIIPALQMITFSLGLVSERKRVLSLFLFGRR